MDPITVSTTLATIVGLICNFKQERKGRQDAKHEDFIEWLEYHRHEEIKNLLANNFNLTSEVDALLKQDTETILSRLNGIDDVLAKILSHFEGFSGIARIVRPGSELSDQAVHFLRSLANSKSDKFRIILQLGDPAFLSMNRGGNIEIIDPRFVEADLETLVTLGFLRKEYGSQEFGITREAVRLVKLIDQNNQAEQDSGGDA